MLARHPERVVDAGEVVDHVGLAYERHDVVRPLDRQRAPVTQPPAEEQEHAGEHQHRRDVDQVEGDPPHHAAAVERQRGHRTDERLVLPTRAAHRLEVQEAQHQRKRDQRGQDAAPEHQLMGEPPRARATADEALEQELATHQAGQRLVG